MVSELVGATKHDFDSGRRALFLYSERFRVLGCVRCFLSKPRPPDPGCQKVGWVGYWDVGGDKERSASTARVDHTQAAIRSGLKQIKARGQVHGTT